MTGLTNGTAYTFTVVATNSVGSSAPSSPSNSVTPAVIVTVPNVVGLGPAAARAAITAAGLVVGTISAASSATVPPESVISQDPVGGTQVKGSAVNLVVSSGRPRVSPMQRNDADGDGKSDLVVFRPSVGGWFIRNSSQGFDIATAQFFQWGLPGDVPIAADFDGDGKIELSVFRPPTGEWSVRYSSQHYDASTSGCVSVGVAGRRPDRGGFRRRRQERARGLSPVQRRLVHPQLLAGLRHRRPRSSSSGACRVTCRSRRISMATARRISRSSGRRPANGSSATPRKATTSARPACISGGCRAMSRSSSDFDGDGKTELAVFRPSIGGWFIRNSSESYAIATASFYQWGLPGDVPIAADFDADGKTELAVFRPATGEWFIRYSAQSYDASTAGVYQWGLAGDVPIKP